jgi:hypothetical protein
MKKIITSACIYGWWSNLPLPSGRHTTDGELCAWLFLQKLIAYCATPGGSGSEVMKKQDVPYG